MIVKFLKWALSKFETKPVEAWPFPSEEAITKVMARAEAIKKKPAVRKATTRKPAVKKPATKTTKKAK
jgi:hypothetical protein